MKLRSMRKGILSPDTDKHPPGQSDIPARQDGFDPVVAVRQLSCQKEGDQTTIIITSIIVITIIITIVVITIFITIRQYGGSSKHFLRFVNLEKKLDPDLMVVLVATKLPPSFSSRQNPILKIQIWRKNRLIFMEIVNSFFSSPERL